MTPYYPTLAEDLARAKEILAKGRWSTDDPFYQTLQQHITSGTIYGADIYAAYKLLESFVEVIEGGAASRDPRGDRPRRKP